MEVWFVSCVTF